MTTGHPINAIPLDKHLAILGTTGSGKSYTARVLIERLLGDHFERGVPTPRVCILDPKGDWFGLRLDKDGKKKGEDFTIIGGPHADEGLRLDDDHPEPMAVPLAQLVAGSDARTVIDLSDLDAGKMRRFVAAFLKTLYHENRRPLTLLVDEADEFAPQQPKGESAISLGAMERIAKRGRARGVRLWMVTQRPASLHKDVLGMAQTVVAMKMGLPHDRKAVREWIAGQVGGVDHKAQESIEKAVVDSLPTLKTGEGWVWVMGQAPERVKFPLIRTFDSMRTPTEGDDFGMITLPPIDAGKLSEELAKVVKENAENDPKALKARIAELEAIIRKGAATASTGGLHARIAELEKQLDAKGRDAEIMDDGRVAQLEAERAGTMRRIRELEHANAGLEDQRRLHVQALKTIRDYAVAAIDGTGMFAPMVPAPNHTHCKGTDGRADVRGPTETTRTVRTNRVERPAPSSSSGLAGPLQKILDAVCWWAGFGILHPSRPQVAGVAGYAVTGGSFARYLSSLSAEKLIHYPGDGLVALTEAGLAKARYAEVDHTPHALHARVREILEGPHRKILDVLLAAGGREMGRTEIAERAGYEASGGSFNRYVSHLSSLKLIRYPNRTTVAAATWLFPEVDR